MNAEQYEGKRTIDGLVVTVDGKRLDEHYEVKRFTKFGFEWTYEGDSPQQLALAILYDHLGDKERADPAFGAVHDGGGRQSRQRLDARQPGDRCVPARQRGVSAPRPIPALLVADMRLIYHHSKAASATRGATNPREETPWLFHVAAC